MPTWLWNLLHWRARRRMSRMTLEELRQYAHRKVKP